MIRKGDYISASTYYSNTIKIPISRLITMLKSGDIIRGYCHKVGWSTNYTEYRITHVDHWGVYAYPTDNMLEKLIGTANKEAIKSYRCHHKFKWCNINGIIFVEDSDVKIC